MKGDDREATEGSEAMRKSGEAFEEDIEFAIDRDAERLEDAGRRVGGAASRRGGFDGIGEFFGGGEWFVEAVLNDP